MFNITIEICFYSDLNISSFKCVSYTALQNKRQIFLMSDVVVPIKHYREQSYLTPDCKDVVSQNFITLALHSIAGKGHIPCIRLGYIIAFDNI